mmetsp:Transcript_5295/g.8634  ORF Transcript_5295/g.8634 Transcript_5295/m.8634 type:complete len:795 (-) Transcript_5295:691-3075(-)
MDANGEVIYAGMLRKKGGRVNVWGERYFVLKDYTLHYYVKPTDLEPKGSFPLQVTCQVSSITSDINKKRKQFVFKLTWKVEEETAEEEKNGETEREDSSTLQQKDCTKGISSGASEAKKISKKKQPNADPKKGAEKETKEDKSVSTGKVAAVAVGGVVVGALTAGVGLLAGMMVVGMGAAGGGAAVALNSADTKDRTLVLASESYQEAENWVNAIEGQINELGDQVLGLPNMVSNNGSGKLNTGMSMAMRRSTVLARTHTVRPEVRLKDVQRWITTSKWKLFDTYEGVRLLQIDHDAPPGGGATGGGGGSGVGSIIRGATAGGGGGASSAGSNGNSLSPPCMRVNLGINGSTSDTFSSIINFSNSLQTGLIKSMRIVENIDNYTDVIHLKLEPLFLYPTWTAPRDFCLMRYWRDNFDGSYVICLDSTTHPECPLVEKYVRGELHAAYIVAPPRAKAVSGYGTGYASVAKDLEDEDGSECMLSFIAQLDPRGWIWESYGYQNSFLKELMLHILDVRDAMDAERFQQVQFDPVSDPKKHNAAADLNASHRNSIHMASSATAGGAGGAGAGGSSGLNGDGHAGEDGGGSIATIPPMVLAPEMWMDSDASTFRVRGDTYMTTKVKTPSTPALFQFLGIDLFETADPHFNIASNPKNRVALAQQRGDNAWVFVVNIIVPGTPYLNFVCYFLGDRALIEADTPFGRIARPFFNGNDDEFRNNRFKLIPKVVDGNLMIKMAVKDTPTLLGNKLKQHYFKVSYTSPFIRFLGHVTPLIFSYQFFLFLTFRIRFHFISIRFAV